MKPRIFKVDPYHVDLEIIKKASEVIHNRGLVAFPTETVYGLGANALDAKAAAGIFEAKKRPLDDPLIVHISKKENLFDLASEVPVEAERLMECFWPGPLTMIFKKTSKVPDIVTTGLDTVAIRMPSNHIARALIDVSDVPIAAPSANLFGRPSPTTAGHVTQDLKGRVDILLDGGKTDIGVESTVVEFADNKLIVLRPGGITVEQLSAIAGRVEVRSEEDLVEASPGKYPQHYSPKAEVSIVDNNESQSWNTLSKASSIKAQGKTVGILSKQEHADKYKDFNVKVLGPGKDVKTCASRLFHVLREFDIDNVDVILAEAIDEQGLGLAVMNRLRKAAGPSFSL